MRRLRPFAAGLFTAAIALAQPVELENFSATGATGAVRPGSTWVGNVQRLTDTIVVGGTAKDDNGWGGSSAGLDLTAMKFVTITGQRNAGNEAPFVVLELRDSNLTPHVVSVSSTQFSATGPTAVEVPLGAWAAGFNPAQVREWTIGGGTIGLLPFRMALDQIAFAASGSSLPPSITAQPVDLLVASGGGATFTVAAAGATSYRWFFGGTQISGATSATLQLSAVTASSAGEYFAEVVNQNGTTSSRRSLLRVVDLQGAHGIAAGGPAGYSAGSSITLSSTISYSGQPGTVSWQVLIPADWQLTAQTSQAASAFPSVGASGLLEWRWSALPASPVTITYTLSVPPETLGPKSITAQAQVTNGGLTGSILAKPDPLLVSMTPRPHSADLNGDYRIGLIELTRVIELYNTRNVGLSRRTGAYLPDVSGEDGFAANPSATGAGKISRYHDADTSRDAQINLIELTRVIEIYNQRSGAVRTGEYRVSSGTEDGFAPGP
ncbi:MAG: immunoglobulin domain-containing protein [Opitutaceae bacterium]